MRLSESAAVPWFLPGVAISALIGIILSGPVGRAVGSRRPLGWALVVSTGAILALTLTPLRDAFRFGAVGTGTCDFSRIGFPSMEEVLRVNDVILNILLFIPLGASLGLLSRSRRKLIVVIAAIALPFAIETTQLFLVALDRSCESGDIVDNLTGLGIGLAAGSLLGRLRFW